MEELFYIRQLIIDTLSSFNSLPLSSSLLGTPSFLLLLVYCLLYWDTQAPLSRHIVCILGSRSFCSPFLIHPFLSLGDRGDPSTLILLFLLLSSRPLLSIKHFFTVFSLGSIHLLISLAQSLSSYSLLFSLLFSSLSPFVPTTRLSSFLLHLHLALVLHSSCFPLPHFSAPFFFLRSSRLSSNSSFFYLSHFSVLHASRSFLYLSFSLRVGNERCACGGCPL